MLNVCLDTQEILNGKTLNPQQLSHLKACLENMQGSIIYV